MNLPDQDHLDKVLLWISYAEEDLGLAQYALKMPGSRPYRLIAFHAQQCAEKYLKAYFVYPDVDEIVTEDEAKQAVDMASNVRETIRKVLVNEGMTIKEDTFK